MKLTISSDAMAATDPRVLGVARALFSGTELPASQQDFVFDFIGLVGLADPLRQSVPAAVRECQTAGIRVVMITGDYPATAREIACQAGLAGSDVVTGDELETSTPSARSCSRLKSRRILKRAFKIDIETCEHCGGAVKVIASIENPAVIKQILEHLERRLEIVLRPMTSITVD